MIDHRYSRAVLEVRVIKVKAVATTAAPSKVSHGWRIARVYGLKSTIV